MSLLNAPCSIGKEDVDKHIMAMVTEVVVQQLSKPSQHVVVAIFSGDGDYALILSILNQKPGRISTVVVLPPGASQALSTSAGSVIRLVDIVDRDAVVAFLKASGESPGDPSSARLAGLAQDRAVDPLMKRTQAPPKTIPGPVYTKAGGAPKSIHTSPTPPRSYILRVDDPAVVDFLRGPLNALRSSQGYSSAGADAAISKWIVEIEKRNSVRVELSEEDSREVVVVRGTTGGLVAQAVDELPARLRIGAAQLLRRVKGPDAQWSLAFSRWLRSWSDSPRDIDLDGVELSTALSATQGNDRTEADTITLEGGWGPVQRAADSVADIFQRLEVAVHRPSLKGLPLTVEPARQIAVKYVEKSIDNLRSLQIVVGVEVQWQPNTCGLVLVASPPSLEMAVHALEGMDPPASKVVRMPPHSDVDFDSIIQVCQQSHTEAAQDAGLIFIFGIEQAHVARAVKEVSDLIGIPSEARSVSPDSSPNSSPNSSPSPAALATSDKTQPRESIFQLIAALPSSVRRSVRLFLAHPSCAALLPTPLDSASLLSFAQECKFQFAGVVDSRRWDALYDAVHKGAPFVMLDAVTRTLSFGATTATGQPIPLLNIVSHDPNISLLPYTSEVSLRFDGVPASSAGAELHGREILVNSNAQLYSLRNEISGLISNLLTAEQQQLAAAGSAATSCVLRVTLDDGEQAEPVSCLAVILGVLDSLANSYFGGMTSATPWCITLAAGKASAGALLQAGRVIAKGLRTGAQASPPRFIVPDEAYGAQESLLEQQLVACGGTEGLPVAFQSQLLAVRITAHSQHFAHGLEQVKLAMPF